MGNVSLEVTQSVECSTILCVTLLSATELLMPGQNGSVSVSFLINKISIVQIYPDCFAWILCEITNQ